MNSSTSSSLFDTTYDKDDNDDNDDFDISCQPYERGFQTHNTLLGDLDVPLSESDLPPLPSTVITHKIVSSSHSEISRREDTGYSLDNTKAENVIDVLNDLQRNSRSGIPFDASRYIKTLKGTEDDVIATSSTDGSLPLGSPLRKLRVESPPSSCTHSPPHSHNRSGSASPAITPISPPPEVIILGRHPPGRNLPPARPTSRPSRPPSQYCTDTYTTMVAQGETNDDVRRTTHHHTNTGGSSAGLSYPVGSTTFSSPHSRGSRPRNSKANGTIKSNVTDVRGTATFMRRDVDSTDRSSMTSTLSTHSSESDDTAWKRKHMLAKKRKKQTEVVTFGQASNEKPALGVTFSFSMRWCAKVLMVLKDSIPPAVFVRCKGILIGRTAQMGVVCHVIAGTCYMFRRLEGGGWSWPCQYGVIGGGAYFGLGVSSTKFVLLVMDDLLMAELAGKSTIVLSRGTHALKVTPHQQLNLTKLAGGVKYSLMSGVAGGLGYRKIVVRPTTNTRLYGRIVQHKHLLEGLVEVPLFQGDYTLYNLLNEIDSIGTSPEWR
eukprot:CFRG2817T1